MKGFAVAFLWLASALTAMAQDAQALDGAADQIIRMQIVKVEDSSDGPVREAWDGSVDDGEQWDKDLSNVNADVGKAQGDDIGDDIEEVEDDDDDDGAPKEAGPESEG